jgi:hypothetical protein
MAEPLLWQDRRECKQRPIALVDGQNGETVDGLTRGQNPVLDQQRSKSAPGPVLDPILDLGKTMDGAKGSKLFEHGVPARDERGGASNTPIGAPPTLDHSIEIKGPTCGIRSHRYLFDFLRESLGPM